MNHTPGPWYYTGSSPEGSVYSKDHELIVPWSPLLSDRKMANARLIAAAPEMLEVLKYLRDALARDLLSDDISERLARLGEDLNDLEEQVLPLLAKIEGP